ncbi:unnamed protein product, partial [Ectocarpus sp. 12 AP-2014]
RSWSGRGPSIGTRVTNAPPSFPALHDTSASLRHKLHPKLGGMGGAPEDLASTAAGGSGVGLQGNGGGNKSSSGRGRDGSGVTTTTTTTTLLDGPDLKYSSPVGSTGGVLRPAPQLAILGRFATPPTQAMSKN